MYLAARARAFSALDLVLEGDFPIEKDAELGFVPVRNGRTVRRHPATGLRYHVFTDAFRARVDAPGLEPARRVDVLTVGCSFSWGHGVEGHETYTSRLARQVGRPAANHAFSAYGTVQSLLTLRRKEVRTPRVVVYGVIQDHLKRNVARCAPTYGPTCLPQPAVRIVDGRPELVPPRLEDYDFSRRFWEAFFFRNVGARPRGLWLAGEAELRRAGRAAEQEADVEQRGQAFAWLLREMHAVAAGIGAELLVVHIPYLEPGTTNDAPRALVDAVERIGAGVSLIDLAGRVRRHHADAAAEPLRFERDRHPSAAAHALIADTLAPYVAQRLARLD